MEASVDRVLVLHQRGRIVRHTGVTTTCCIILFALLRCVPLTNQQPEIIYNELEFHHTHTYDMAVVGHECMGVLSKVCDHRYILTTFRNEITRLLVLVAEAMQKQQPPKIRLMICCCDVVMFRRKQKCSC